MLVQSSEQALLVGLRPSADERAKGDVHARQCHPHLEGVRQRGCRCTERGEQLGARLLQRGQRKIGRQLGQAEQRAVRIRAHRLRTHVDELPYNLRLRTRTKSNGCAWTAAKTRASGSFSEYTTHAGLCQRTSQSNTSLRADAVTHPWNKCSALVKRPSRTSARASVFLMISMRTLFSASLARMACHNALSCSTRTESESAKRGAAYHADGRLVGDKVAKDDGVCGSENGAEPLSRKLRARACHV
jgi:hypothetical protein